MVSGLLGREVGNEPINKVNPNVGAYLYSGDKTSGNTEAAAWETLQHHIKVVPRVVWSKGWLAKCSGHLGDHEEESVSDHEEGSVSGPIVE